MSSSDRVCGRPLALCLSRGPAARGFAARVALVALAIAVLPGCTVSPLYGTSKVDALQSGAPGTDLAALRGQISVAPAGSRTAQVFRNALLFRLNGGKAPTAPVYQIKFAAAGVESVVSIQRGSGIAAASLFRMTVSYDIIRLSDGKSVAKGRRIGTAPFDRSGQYFAATRGVIDARERASAAAAEQVELAIMSAIRKDLMR